MRAVDRGLAGSLAALSLLVLLGFAARAQAIPAFSRKYGMACTACHEAWPKLNQQGEAFRDNGYQWLAGTDNTVKLDPAYWPISVRATTGYLYDWQSNQPYAGGAKTVRTGRIGISGVDFLLGGTLTDNVSFLFVYEPFLTNANWNLEFPTQTSALSSPGEGGYLESAWVRIDNLIGIPYLNLKVGRGALDVPFDEHRNLFVIDSNYGVFHYHPPGSFNPFELGTDAWQLSIEGHDDGSRLRFALTYFQTQFDPGSDGPFPAHGVYGHVQYTWFPQRQGLAQVQVGAFGALGSYPTQAAYKQPDDNGDISGPIVGPGADYGGAAGAHVNVVSNTGFDNAPFSREGADVDLKFNTLAKPFDLRLMGVFGQENRRFSIYGQSANGSALVPAQDALWGGGLAEIDWTPLLNHTIALRYDFVRNIQQTDAANLSLHEGDQDTLGICFRWQIDVIPRTGTAVMVELDRNLGYLTGAEGNTTEQYIAFGGIDVAF